MFGLWWRALSQWKGPDTRTVPDNKRKTMHKNKKRPTTAVEKRLARFVGRDRARASKQPARRLPLAVSISELMNGPQRELTANQIATETIRLVKVCAERGVGAVLRDVCTCRALLRSLAEACHTAGLTAAGQYLDYLALPLF